MSQRGISQLLLIVLGVLAVAFVVRQCADGGGPRSLVEVGDGQDPDRLRQQSFRVEQPARFVVEATGSFQSPSALAAYGWIVRRSDGAVVWQMTPENVTSGRGTIATATDTLALDPGIYNAYFTSFGDPLVQVEDADSVGDWLSGVLRFGDRPWASDQSKWTLRLNPLRASDGAHTERLSRRDVQALDAARDAAPGIVWATGPVGDDERLSHTFAVTAPTSLRVNATGELYRGATDYATIDNLVTGEQVWTMTAANTEPAGGSVKNRRARTTLRLTPGVYRATFVTDGSHDADRWTANPPLDPTAWGLRLWTDTPRHVEAFDPWQELPRLVEMTGVGNEALETAMFTLQDSLHAWVYALGEMRSRDKYDHAWLIREGSGTVWEMEYDRTRHAGGEGRNRLVEESLVLPPGTYTLHFESDDTHSPERWYDDAPDHPERWGVTLFALGRGGSLLAEAPAVEVTRQSSRNGARPDIGPTPPRSPDGSLPVRLAPLRNNEDVERTFTLDGETRLRIYAIGEILRTDRYDYGWITDERADDVVWEMTRSNTEAAGGSRKNRRFEGTITLPAGTYSVRFETDGSHAYGDFSQGSPDDPTAWGIVVERAEVPAPPPPPPPPSDSIAAPETPQAEV